MKAPPSMFVVVKLHEVIVEIPAKMVNFLREVIGL
jgi:hypothetical protein